MAERPLWKIREQQEKKKKQEELVSGADSLPAGLPLDIDKEPPKAPNVLVDAVTIGTAEKGTKPMVRHVLIKDLSKIATRLKLEPPKTGVFKDKAPMGLYALFDGQSCAGQPGPGAAEFCARNFHTKLLQCLSKLPPDQAHDTFVQSALIWSFKTLDEELLATDIDDGCGAAVLLLIGDRAFTAVVGKCNAILCEVAADKQRESTPVPLGGSRGTPANPEERRRLMGSGAVIIGEGADSRIRHPSGVMSPVSRSLGDRLWKGASAGGIGPTLVTCTPEVQSAALKGYESHPFILLSASSVASVLTPRDLLDTAEEFSVQPRAACVCITNKAAGNGGAAASVQYTSVEICFLPPREEEKNKDKKPEAPADPLKKKPKLADAAPGGGTRSVRIRHILCRYSDGPQPKAQAAGKKVSRNKAEAEETIIKAIRELKEEAKELKKTKGTPKDANAFITMITPKFVKLCREMSDCDTAQKGGNMCGDLGWVTPEERTKMGGSFKEVVDVLLPGQISDIAASDQGLHLVQRIA
eukprot:gnl/TRDRNA2_/TRDRNA2_175900_c0_seq6.p1 gnl/TRDRNA2_/TRDRNA2_175900_c0~~gnl/TRDRNA2_/TRDRNA2_175900_c0_seq6.p1  ORF type:complete len:526 (+),score=104.28 gnl/TRDRNA2_/TRDRNA2_175900_c0_seq6:88-1665(+)